MLLIAVVLMAWTQAAGQPAKPKRPAQTEALIDRARALPPEFTADLLIRLASSSVIADRIWKTELLEEAFTAAGNAQHATLRIGAMNTDSRFGPIALGSDLKLDVLTLRNQAVEAMQTLSPARALQMFQEIHLPELKPVNCRSIVIERVDAYYELLPKVYAQSFTPAQRRKGEDVALVEQTLHSIHSDVEIEPVAATLFKSDATLEARQRWLDTLAVMFPSLSGTDRTFTSGAWQGLLELASFAQRNGLASGGYLDAMRAYIVRRITGPRCDDRGRTSTAWLIESANAVIQAEIAKGNGDLRPIKENEIEPGPNLGHLRVRCGGSRLDQEKS